MAKFSYNNSKHFATTLTPFFANYGFHPLMSLLPPAPASQTSTADSYVQRLREAQDILQRELLEARKAIEVFANRRRQHIFIQSSMLASSSHMWQTRSRAESWRSLNLSRWTSDMSCTFIISSISDSGVASSGPSSIGWDTTPWSGLGNRPTIFAMLGK